MATLHGHADGTRRIYAKGSIESILSRCDQMLTADGQVVPLEPADIHARVETLASSGLRVLALARGTLTGDRLEHENLGTVSGATLVFIGLQAMIDPPRPEAMAAVQACQSAASGSK